MAGTLKEEAEGRRDDEEAAKGSGGQNARRSVAHVRIAAVDGRMALAIVAFYNQK